jgi:hypothetical protein
MKPLGSKRLINTLQRKLQGIIGTDHTALDLVLSQVLIGFFYVMSVAPTFTFVSQTFRGLLHSLLRVSPLTVSTMLTQLMFTRHVNFPLRSVKHGAINAYVGVQVQQSTFVASALNRAEWSAVHACAPHPRESVYPQNKRRIWHHSLSVENRNFSFLWLLQ